MVAKFLDLNNLSSQQQPFALSNDGSEVWATVLLLSNHAQERHTCQFFSFFSARLAGPQFVKIQTFCFHGNTTWQLLPSTTKPSNFTGKLHLHTSTKTFCQWPQIYMHPRLKWETTIYIYNYIYLLNIWQFIKMCNENPLLWPGHDNTCTMYCKYLNLTKRGCQVFRFCSFQIKKWLIFWENTTGLLPPGHSGCIKGVAIHKGEFSNCTCSQIPCLRCNRTVI